MIFLNLICILITLIFDKKFFILYRKQYISCIYFVLNSFLFFSFILLSFFLNKNILENIFYFIFYFLFFFFLSFLIYINKIPEYLSIKVYFRNSYLLTLLVFNLSHVLFFFFFFFNLKFLFFKFCLNLLFLTLIIYLLNFFQIYKINFLDFQIKSYWEWLLNKFAPQDSKQDFFFNLEINISNLFSFLSLILFLFYTPLILLNIKFINFFNFNFIYFIIYPIILITFINTFSMFLNILLKNKRIKLNFKILNKISLTFLFLIF
jgi:hypothetical protein